MFNVEKLQNDYARKPSTIGQQRREVTDEEIQQALVGEGLDYLLSRKPNEKSTPVQDSVYRQALAADKKGFSTYVEKSLSNLSTALDKARQSENTEKVMEVEQDATDLLHFLRRVQNQVSRNTVMLLRRADNRQLAKDHANGDQRTPQREPYDGYAVMELDNEQVTRVFEATYDQFTIVYGLALQFAGTWANTNLGDLPIANVNIDGAWSDVYDFNVLRESMENNMVAPSREGRKSSLAL